MSGYEKDVSSQPTMPAQAHRTGASSNRGSSFLPTYEQHVNDNMRAFGPDNSHIQAFDRIQELRKTVKRKRAVIFVIVGILLVVGAVVAGVAAWKAGEGGHELRQSAGVTVVTQTISPTSSSFVWISTTTETTTVATTAPIPSSIANAAASYYGEMSSSIASRVSEAKSIVSAPLTSLGPSTSVTWVPPPPVTITTTLEPLVSDAVNAEETSTVLRASPKVGFCGVPGGACG